MENNIRFHHTSNLTEVKMTATKYVKNSNIYKDNRILVYQFLSLKITKKSKTNVNYGTPPSKTKLQF